MTVMKFIRVQDEHLTGHTLQRCPPVPEGLDAVDRQANGVGIVPVRIEGVP
jgi:hypothetical protein